MIYLINGLTPSILNNIFAKESPGITPEPVTHFLSANLLIQANTYDLMRIFYVFLYILFLSFAHAQPASWTASGIGGGGSLFSPAISPHNTSIMYMQCDMSEVFQTTDAGLNWQPVPFTRLISTGGQHRVEFTSDPDILYTVNYAFNEDLRYPVRSDDGGATWTAISGDPTGGEVWFISADPASTNRLIISSYDALYISLNGGSSFNLVYDNNSDFHIAGVFWDGNNIFVGTQIGMLVSTNGGASFVLDAGTGIPAGQGFISLTGAKNGGTTRLMGTTASQADLYPGVNALDVGIYSTILRRDYGITNWTPATSGINAGHDLFCIASARNNTDIFYTGGNNPSNSYPVVYKTTNGGLSWSEVFLAANNQNIYTGYSGYQGDEDWWYGEIVFGLAVAPNDANTAIITDFGFAHVTQDGGATWRQAYVSSSDQNPAGTPTPKDKAYGNNGLENTSCWHLHWSKNNANLIFASYTDITAVRSTDGGNKWAFSFNGINYNTVYHVVEHPTNGTLFAAVSSVHDLYQSTYLTDASIDGGTGAILYSTDNGANWNMLHNFNHPVIWLAIDPNNANRMYASVVHSSSGGIYKTENLNLLASSSWTATTAPPRTQGHPYNVYVLDDGTVVTSWSGRRAPNFTASSGIFISSNQGASWTDVSDNPNMHYWTKDITIDPNDAGQNTWYVSVFSGWGGPANDKGGLYRTTDRGGSWTRIFNSYRVESCTIDPVNPNKIFATTESEGLWYSPDGTAANPTFTQQPSYSFMHPVRVIYNPHDLTKIWVTSFGNGIKQGTAASVPLPVLDPDLQGIAMNDHNELSWKVTNEDDIKSFKLEKSEDGNKFTELYTADFAGNNVYKYQDKYFGYQDYYRLLITDQNGGKSYSRTIAIRRPAENNPVINIYPNPVENNLNLRFTSSLNGPFRLNIRDEAGVIRFSKLINKTEPVFEKQYTLDKLDQGSYFISVSGKGGNIWSEKFIKIK